MPAPFTISELEESEDFKTLNPQGREQTRLKYLRTFVLPDENFKTLNPADKSEITSRVMAIVPPSSLPAYMVESAMEAIRPPPMVTNQAEIEQLGPPTIPVPTEETPPAATSPNILTRIKSAAGRVAAGAAPPEVISTPPEEALPGLAQVAGVMPTRAQTTPAQPTGSPVSFPSPSLEERMRKEIMEKGLKSETQAIPQTGIDLDAKIGAHKAAGVLLERQRAAVVPTDANSVASFNRSVDDFNAQGKALQAEIKGFNQRLGQARATHEELAKKIPGPLEIEPYLRTPVPDLTNPPPLEQPGASIGASTPSRLTPEQEAKAMRRGGMAGFRTRSGELIEPRTAWQSITESKPGTAIASGWADVPDMAIAEALGAAGVPVEAKEQVARDLGSNPTALDTALTQFTHIMGSPVTMLSFMLGLRIPIPVILSALARTLGPKVATEVMAVVAQRGILGATSFGSYETVSAASKALSQYRATGTLPSKEEVIGPIVRSGVLGALLGPTGIIPNRAAALAALALSAAACAPIKP